nr:MAG TPA: hypothetical protein [Caudoviricetes sp.]
MPLKRILPKTEYVFFIKIMDKNMKAVYINFNTV